MADNFMRPGEDPCQSAQSLSDAEPESCVAADCRVGVAAEQA
jgi:hypothetical protein